MMRRCLVILSIAFTSILSAQTRVDLGLSVGTQSYSDSGDSPRFLPGAEILFRGDALAGHVAVEYADLSVLGQKLIAVHGDVAYRFKLGHKLIFTIGAGPSVIDLGAAGREVTWNAETELAREWNNVHLFVRARQYEYTVEDVFRSGDYGPTSAAVYIGARFPVRR